MRTIVTLIVASACLTAVSPARAGLLEDIFGVSASPAAQRLEGREDGFRRPAKARTKLKAFGASSRQASADASKARATTADASSKRPNFCSWEGEASKPLDRTEALMRDATLRPGDVIMTDEGVRVFAGRAACPHTVADFRTLAEARTLPRAERTTLAAIEQASKAKPSSSTEPQIVASDPPRRAKQ